MLVNSSYSGNNALHIEILEDDNDWELWAPIRNADKLAVTPGDTVRYSVMVQATSIDGIIKKSFVTYDNKNNVIEQNAGAMDINFVYEQYVEYPSYFIIPDGVSFVSPRLTGHGKCDITVDDFELKGTFHISFSNEGAGTVTTPEGYHNLGSEIEIEAMPDAGNKFVGWIGDYVGYANPATLTITGDLNITARFVDEGYELVNKYYISTTGNDDNDGSLENPWATVTYGSSQLYPGDTLIIQSGIYYGDIEKITNSGGNGIYITILAEEDVIFELSSKNHEYGVFGIIDASWVIVDGITLINTKTHAFKVLGRCNNIIIRNCRTEHTAGCGILIQGSRGYPWDKRYYISDILLENNEIHWPQESYFDGTPENELPSHEDITLMQGVENFEIRHNYVNAYDSINYHGGPIAIDVKDGVRFGKIHHNTTEYIPSSGIYIDALDTYAHHIDIYQNYIYYVTAFGLEAGAERGGPIDSVKIFNNIVNKSGWAGIGSGDYNGGSGPTHDKIHIDIFNNTIAHAGYLDWGWGILTASSYKEGKIYNNIMYDCMPNGMHLNRQDNNIVTNNCIYKLVGSDSGDEGKNVLKQDPQFVDQAHANFYLKGTSPCIDAGIVEGSPDIDYNGTARPIGEGFDMGAFEVEKSQGLFNEVLPVKNIQVYPNPFSGKTTIGFTVNEPTHVKLSVYDAYGKEIEVLINKKYAKDNYNIVWNANNLPAGIYYCQIQSNSESIIKKVVLSR